jgi:hypothetical protein
LSNSDACSNKNIPEMKKQIRPIKSKKIDGKTPAFK